MGLELNLPCTGAMLLYIFSIWCVPSTSQHLTLMCLMSSYSMTYALIPQVYYVSSGRSGVCGKKVCIAVSITVVVLLALLFDVVIALLCAVAFYIVGLVYVYCCMPLALVLQYRPDMLSDLEEV